MLAMVEDPSDGGCDGAAESVATPPVRKDFVAVGVLLGCEGVGDGCGRLNLSCCSRGWIDALGVAIQVNVLQAERGIIMDGARVFAGAQEEVESDDN